MGWFSTFGNHPYKKNEKKIQQNYDGVVFLHDFYDGPHYYGKGIFDDFFQWTLFTLKLIENNNLNVAVKVHPFQSSQSKKICSLLQKEFKSIFWIDKVSNKEIFQSGIKFGITKHGTVISELAFHNILPIFCADHPIEYFKIGFKATSIDEYTDYILNYPKLKFDKNLMNELGKFYYMHHIYDKSDYKLESIDGFSLKGIQNRFIYDTKDLSLIK